MKKLNEQEEIKRKQYLEQNKDNNVDFGNFGDMSKNSRYQKIGENMNNPTLFVAWLNQISFHTCYDICKSRKTDYGDIDSEMMEEICDSKPDSNPENVVMDTDEKKRLKDAISRLSALNQQLITLRYFNNMKIDDIVKATGISKSTVKRNLQSAVESLKNMMGGKV